MGGRVLLGAVWPDAPAAAHSVHCHHPTPPPQTLKEKLQGLGKDIQAVDTSDLDYEVIKKQLA